MEVSKPQVIFKEKDGKRLEPMELVSVEVPETYSGAVIEMMGKRLGQMKNMRMDEKHNAFMDFEIPTRGLIGIRNKFLTGDQGHGHHEFAISSDTNRTGAISRRSRTALLLPRRAAGQQTTAS